MKWFAKPSAMTSVSASTFTARRRRRWPSTFCRRAEEYAPYFVEEATQIEDIDELAFLRSKTSIPLATGERLFTKWGFSEICERHLVDFLQPDVVHCGGISELKKIGLIGQTHRIELAPHNPQSNVSTMA